MTIAGHIQGADLGARVILYQLDLTMFGLDVLYLSPTSNGPSVVSFGNQDYAPHPIEAEGFELSVEGTLPRPTFTVSNLDNSFTALVEQSDDLQGAILTRIRTYERYLDSGVEPDGLAHLPPDVFLLSVKTAHTPETISWDCAALMDQEGVQLPARIILRDYCDHTYRRWDATAGAYDYQNVTCPYTGGGSWDANDDAVAASADRCGKRLTGCRLRFGANGVLPTRAFPGVARMAQR